MRISTHENASTYFERNVSAADRIHLSISLSISVEEWLKLTRYEYSQPVVIGQMMRQFRNEIVVKASMHDDRI